ncbi:DUF4910 domain-containing protein [Marinicrinis sediminis]|uniref:DUF4910 domain-containing protein n=1 Tax=Marinicrinis sediminis TaxID=1652465 RepID=A0ABW5RB55_9BACL
MQRPSIEQDRIDLTSSSHKQQERWQIEQLFDRLFPICRSITGPGLRQSLDILSEWMPLEHFSVASGTRLFDWEVPKEWRIRSATLTDPQGRVIADFDTHNLHVLNYSIPVDGYFTLDELKSHLYTNPVLPNSIPYVTSYYKERWGFCLTQDIYDQLKPGRYHAHIDSELVEGEMNYAHAILPGECEEEILISSYLCHPSMANNELSGPITAAMLYQRLSRWQKRRFTYRFVFAPETIGSIAYLHQFGKGLKARMHAGMILTCLGGQEPLSYKQSRQGHSPLDLLWHHLFASEASPNRTRPFTPNYGSDERQYNSPGFNLPVGQISRMLHASFPEYHSSADTKEVMTMDALVKSADEIEHLLLGLELDGYYVNQSPYGEVKLDRYGLYPDMNQNGILRQSNNQLVDGRKQLNRILTILNYADGQHNLQEIAEKCQSHGNIYDLQPVIHLLIEKGLLKGPYSNRMEPFEI